MEGDDMDLVLIVYTLFFNYIGVIDIVTVDQLC